jgi:hypothetical protein
VNEPEDGPDPSTSASSGADDAAATEATPPEAAPAADPTAADAAPARSISPRSIVIGVGVVIVAALIGLGIAVYQGNSSKSSTTTTEAAGSGSGSGPTWSHAGLDGKVIVVSAGTTGSSRFTTVAGKQVPLAVVAIDKAMTDHGCQGVLAVYEVWSGAARTGATSHARDRASAFAAYARDEGKAHQCSWAAKGS